jgi:hypothetical protein
MFHTFFGTDAGKDKELKHDSDSRESNVTGVRLSPLHKAEDEAVTYVPKYCKCL